MAGVPQVVQSPKPDPVIDVTHDCLSGDRVLMLRIASLEQRSSRGVSMPTLSPASIPTDEQVFVDKLIGQSPWSTRSVTPSTQCGRRDGQLVPAVPRVAIRIGTCGRDNAAEVYHALAH